MISPMNIVSVFSTAVARTWTGLQTFVGMIVRASSSIPLIVRQDGGVAGTDEFHLYFDATSYATFRTKGAFNRFSFLTSAGVVITYVDETDHISAVPIGMPFYAGYRLSSAGVRLASGSTLGFSASDASAAADTYFDRNAAGVFGCNSQIEFAQVADVGTPASNHAGIGAEDVAGTAELIGYDEAGNETQITPHNTEGPADLYVETPGKEHVIRTLNSFTDRVDFLNLTRLAKAVEKLTGEKLTHSESLASFNARTGRQKPTRDWNAVQADHQKRYDAERKSEAVKLAEWLKLEPAKRQGERPAVRPAKSIVKPKPASLTA